MKKNRAKKGCIFKGIAAVLIGCILVSTMLFTAVSAAESKKDFKYEGMKLAIGGFPFGVRFSTDGVLVISNTKVSSGGKAVSPSEDAGIKPKDLIKEINGIKVSTGREIFDIVANGDGSPLKIKVVRDGKALDLNLTPAKEDGSGIFRAGMELKDSMAGIGTVTYYNAESGEYGGLGHGICDGETGALMPLSRGSSMEVRIGGVVKGVSGKPGEIKGSFLSKRTGNVLSNTSCGVFGVFLDIPKQAQLFEIGSRDDVKDGKAYIRTTLGEDGIKEYEIEVSKISRESKDNKSFVITVTDKALKDRCGGIVQGMSGSPIIQDGKLIGAVTHVLVSDPSRGYGIFIENMLDNSK